MYPVKSYNIVVAQIFHLSQFCCYRQPHRVIVQFKRDKYMKVLGRLQSVMKVLIMRVSVLIVPLYQNLTGFHIVLYL